MRNSRFKQPFYLVIFLACIPIFWYCSVPESTDGNKSSGNTYYIDDEGGNDANSGRKENQAWLTLEKVNSTDFQPGDKILFRAGGRWNGQLWPKGSGTNGFPVVVDMFGEGQKPLIAADGEFRDAVKLINQQYWEIKNLEISNYREGDDQLDTANQKRGVYILAKDAGDINHIHLIDLHIHHVNGLLEPNFPAKNNGGIFFEILGHTTKTRFNDFLIEGCYVHDVDRTGISNKSSWWDRTIDDNMDWVPSVNVVIKNTVVERAGYNAVIVRCTDGALVENCVFKNNGHKGNGNALFIFQTDNTLVQYCEAYGTVYQEGTNDAAGFDSDGYNHNSVFQYNYSHDNGLGGLVMAVGDGDAPFNNGAVWRYNICQNNKREEMRLSGYPTNVRIYNNVFYIDSTESRVNIIHHKKWGGWPSRISYYNNIFYNLSHGGYYSLGEGSNIEFSHNVFFGNPAVAEPEDPFKMTADPKFLNPGSGGRGIESVSGYKLHFDSPCIDQGLLLSNHGDADFWGNPLPANNIPDRGVHEINPEKPD